MFLPAPESLRGVRALVRKSLDGHGRETVDAAVLIANELATNAVEYARTPFDVRVDADDDPIRIAVSDADPRPPRQKDAQLLDERGRGLLIVEQLARRWGVRRLGDDGKVVWAELDAAGPPVTNQTAQRGRRVRSRTHRETIRTA